MLFDSVFNNPQWKGQDHFPSCKEWKLEINKRLEFIKSKNELNRFLKRLNATKTQRDEALAEILAAYVLEEKLKYKIIQWEKPTINGKNIDLLVLIGSEEIFCEVKSPGWEAELSQKERLSDRKSKPKYINAEVRSVAPWENIQYSLFKAYGKFLPDKKNIVILCHDLFDGFLELPNDLNINNSLYSNSLHFNNLIKKNGKGCFSDNTYENIGGLLLIEDYLFCKDNEVTYKYKFFPNKYSKNTIYIQT